MIVDVEQTRAAGYLGASEAAAALGADPYRSPLEIWQAMRAAAAGFDPGERQVPPAVAEAAAWGQILEPVIRSYYARTAGVVVLVPIASITAGRLRLRATPDGIVVPAGVGCGHAGTVLALDDARHWRDRWIGGLQVKTASAFLAHAWEDGRIPVQYEIQVRVEMAVTGLPWVDVICLIGGQRIAGPVRVHRDADLEARIVADLRSFLDSVDRGVEPPVDGSDAWSARIGERLARHAATVPATPKIAELLATYRAVKLAARDAEADVRRVRNDVLAAMAEAGAVRVSTDVGVFSASKNAGRADWKGYARSLGGAASVPPAFAGTATGTWRLNTPRGWLGADDDDA